MVKNVPREILSLPPMKTTNFVCWFGSWARALVPVLLTCIAAVLSRKTGRTRLLLLFLLSAVHRTIFPLPPRRLLALRRPLARVWGLPAADRHRVLAAHWTYRGTRTRTHPAHVSAAISKNILPPVIPKMINNHRKCCVFVRKQLKLVPFTHRRAVNKAVRLHMCATLT